MPERMGVALRDVVKKRPMLPSGRCAIISPTRTTADNGPIPELCAACGWDGPACLVACRPRLGRRLAIALWGRQRCPSTDRHLGPGPYSDANMEHCQGLLGTAPSYIKLRSMPVHLAFRSTIHDLSSVSVTVASICNPRAGRRYSMNV